MNNLLENIKSMTSSKYFILLYLIIFLYSLFNGKISSRYYVKEIKKIIESKYEIVDELMDELIKSSKVQEKFNEYMNCSWKWKVYSLIGFASLGQLVILMIQPDVDQVSANVCMLTMTISFLESRDNRSMSKNMKKEIDLEIKKMLDDFYDIKSMAIEDLVLDRLVEEKKITEEKRAEIIKSNKSI